MVKSKKAAAAAVQAELTRRLRIAVALSALAAIVAGVLVQWDALLGHAPERVINIYRTHGCKCAFEWAKTLEAHGYIVRLREYETLEYVRHSLRVPDDDVHGCHVAQYLQYFIDGHASSTELQQLAKERPTALGLVAAQTTLHTKQGDITVIDRDGRRHF